MNENTASIARPRGLRVSHLVLKGSVLQVLEFGCELLVALFMMPFLIHTLGEHRYGYWALVGTIIGQLSLADIGLASTTQRYMAKAFASGSDADAISTYSTSLALFAGIGTGLFIVTLAALPAVSYFISDRYAAADFSWALAISGLNLALSLPFSVLGGSLLSRFRSDAYSCVQFAKLLVRTAIAYFAISSGYGIWTLAAAALAGALLERVLLAIFMRHLVPGIRFEFSSVRKSRALELLRFGRFVFLARFADALRYRADNLLIAPLAGIVAVTHYSVAGRLADYFDVSVGQVSHLASPLYVAHSAQGQLKALSESFLTVSRICALLSSAGAATIVVFAKQFLILWLGPNFSQVYVPLTLLIASVYFSLLQGPSNDILTAVYKHPFASKMYAVEAAANVLLTVLLIPRLGITGAALGTAIPMIINRGIILPIYTCAQIDMHPLLYLGAIAPSIALAAGCGVLGSFIPLDHIHGLAGLLLAAAIYACALCALLYCTLPPSDRVLLRGGLRSLLAGFVR